MTQTALKTRLGKRLNQLFTSIHQDAEIVWDLCCDHGALGRAVLETRPTTQVMFNDIHPNIMARLSDQLKRLRASNYHVVVSPAQQIELQANAAQTVVLAGIGDEQCITVLKALSAQVNAKNCRFIVSPTTKVALVRDYMIDAGFYLVNQTTVTENKRTYEVISICTTDRYGGHRMSNALGDDIGSCWTPCAEHIQHLTKLIGYYKGQALNLEKPYAKRLLNQYKEILNKLNSSP